MMFVSESVSPPTHFISLWSTTVSTLYALNKQHCDEGSSSFSPCFVAKFSHVLTHFLSVSTGDVTQRDPWSEKGHQWGARLGC